MPAFANRNAVRITDARGSLAADVRGRQRRYLVAMTFRVVAFVASVLLLHGALRWIAAGFAMVLPWVAVVVANAGQDRRADAPLPTVSVQRTALRAGDSRPWTAGASADDGEVDGAAGPVADSGPAADPGPVADAGAPAEPIAQWADHESGSAVQDRTTAGS